MDHKRHNIPDQTIIPTEVLWQSILSMSRVQKSHRRSMREPKNPEYQRKKPRHKWTLRFIAAKVFLPSPLFFFLLHGSPTIHSKVEDTLELSAHSPQKSFKFPKAKALVWHKGRIKQILIIIKTSAWKWERQFCSYIKFFCWCILCATFLRRIQMLKKSMQML